MTIEFNDACKQETDYTNSQNISGSMAVVNGDKIGVLYVTTGSADVTITLTATETKREITVKKIDDGVGDIVFVGSIDGDTTKKIGSQNTAIKIQYDATASQWRIL